MPFDMNQPVFDGELGDRSNPDVDAATDIPADAATTTPADAATDTPANPAIDTPAGDAAGAHAESSEEGRADADQRPLLERFAQSPEWQALEPEQRGGGWADLMVLYAMSDLSLTPPLMTAENLREVVFHLFPEKVARPASEAPNAIRELRAFWQFLEREYALPNAAAALQVLDNKAALRLEIAMGNPANYSPEKALAMSAPTRSALPFAGALPGLPGPGAELPEGGDYGLPAGTGSGRKSPPKAAQKAKRKMVKASKRKNRPK